MRVIRRLLFVCFHPRARIRICSRHTDPGYSFLIIAGHPAWDYSAVRAQPLTGSSINILAPGDLCARDLHSRLSIKELLLFELLNSPDVFTAEALCVIPLCVASTETSLLFSFRDSRRQTISFQFAVH